MTAGTFDKEGWSKKTYPNATGDPNAEDTFANPGSNPGKRARDIYCLVAPFEGSGLGPSGMVAVGFLAPQVSEMLFSARRAIPTDPAKAAGFDPFAFADMDLERHGSDMQTTTDYKAKHSRQHPAGTRVTVGASLTAVDLTGEDYDEEYELWNNINDWANYKAEIIGPDEDATPDPTKRFLPREIKGFFRGLFSGASHVFGLITVFVWNQIGCYLFLDGNGDTFLHANKDEILTNAAGCMIRLNDDGTILIHAPNGLAITSGDKIEVGALGGDLTLTGSAGLNVGALGGDVTLDASGNVTEQTAGVPSAPSAPTVPPGQTLPDEEEEDV